MSRGKVIAAMSGGVDSSVAAALLAEQGYEVLGVTLRMWRQTPDDGADRGLTRKYEQDAADVATKLGIRYEVQDVTGKFAQCVVSRFVDEYRAGRTPNPCVKCNPEIKFASLLAYADSHGAEYVVTGHYARIEREQAEETWRLLRGADRSKDQSYVLYRLTQRELPRILMPLGAMQKQEVRQMARELGISVYDKAESQDICFIPEGRYQDFLREFSPELVKPGPIVDTNGRQVGTHDGVAFFTVGQRRGLRLASGRRLYVVRVDAETNTVVVGGNEDLERDRVVIGDTSFVSGRGPSESVVVSAKIRYNTQDRPAALSPLGGGWYELVFEAKQRAVTPGQSAVMYRGEEVLGGGIIANEREAEEARARA